MNNNQGRKPPVLPENPWLTRGTAHILKGTRSTIPANCHPIQLEKESKSTYKEYSLQSKDFPSSSSLEDCLTKVSCYIDSLLISNDGNEEQLDKFNDYSVFDDYESIGLFNEGNNCYQNCVIQCLLHFPPFFHLLSKLNELYCNSENPYTPYLTFFCRIVEVMKKYKKEKPSIQTPCRLNLRELRDLIAIKNVMFSEDQSDVQEFFLYLVDEISKEVDSLSSNPQSPIIDNTNNDDEWEEVGSKGRKLVIRESVIQRSIINQLFEVQLRKKIKSYGKREHIEQQSYLTISLPISDSNITSVDAALEEYLFGGYYNSPGYRIEQSPSCLVLQLMLFYYDKKQQKPMKMKKHIDFKAEINLDDYECFDTVKHTHYELYAVISHRGNSPMNGHYFCYCKTSNDNSEWICCNDDVIRSVNMAEVLHTDPYMLFYRAID